MGASNTGSTGTTGAEEIVAYKHKAGSDDLKDRATSEQSLLLRNPLHGRAQASPRVQWLHSGNRFAVMSDLPEQDNGNSKEVKETVKAEDV